MPRKLRLKACRNCKALVDLNAEKCPVCGSTAFTKLWMGYVIVIDPAGSEVAKKMNVTVPGMYAIRLSR